MVFGRISGSSHRFFLVLTAPEETSNILHTIVPYLPSSEGLFERGERLNFVLGVAGSISEEPAPRLCFPAPPFIPGVIYRSRYQPGCIKLSGF